MTTRLAAIFLLLAAPAAALGRGARAADRLPLLWMWMVAGVVLLAALAWLLFGGRTHTRRRASAPPPPRP